MNANREAGMHGMGSARDSGVLLHVTSLPGGEGIGDLGPAAHKWAEMLGRARQGWWQILPLGPAGEGDSPYSAMSAFAGDPNLISLDGLVRDGLLAKGEVRGGWREGRVDYPKASRFKARLLSAAWARFKGGGGRRLRDEYDRFCAREAAWLEDFAVFMAIREATGNQPWRTWPRELAFGRKDALRAAQRELAEPIRRQRFAQFVFDRQWRELRRHARASGIRILGDLPMFVSGESADVWAHPDLFQLDRERRPVAVAGVPPDLFSETGQLWGNPLYNWSALRKEGYAWWIARLRCTLARVDAVRLDHFRGFEGYWSVPAKARTAKHGRWVKAPGDELLRRAMEELGGLPLVAEDLGVITPPVEALRDRFGLPGMRVLQFGFGGSADSPHLPHNFMRHCVAYTGTHDNDTAAGWFRSLGRDGRRHVREYLPDADEGASWALARAAWASVAEHAIVPAQDLLGLGSEARMNRPATASGNWRWRLREGQLTGELLDRLGAMTVTYGRAATK